MAKYHVCDKCGKNLGGYRWLPLFDVEEVPYYVIARGRRGKLELCPKCNKEFSKILDDWIENKHQKGD
jgi:ribosomal protein L37AE/L43A